MKTLLLTTMVLGITCMFGNAPSMASSANQYETPTSFPSHLYLARGGGERMGGHAGGERMDSHPGGEQMSNHHLNNPMTGSTGINPQINRNVGGYGDFVGSGGSNCFTLADGTLSCGD